MSSPRAVSRATPLTLSSDEWTVVLILGATIFHVPVLCPAFLSWEHPGSESENWVTEPTALSLVTIPDERQAFPSLAGPFLAGEGPSLLDASWEGELGHTRQLHPDADDGVSGDLQLQSEEAKLIITSLHRHSLHQPIVRIN